MHKGVMALGAMVVIAAPAAAEVKSASPNAFEIEHRLTAPVPPEILYRQFAAVSGWWNPDHSYSGSAANLSIDLRPGGCWCERLPGGGGVEHMRVAIVEPGKRIVFTGSLGPLLTEATAGVMQVKFERAAGGSTLILNYRAAGFATGSGARFAPAVDGVLGEAMKRLRAHASARASTG